jgi:flagellar biosynthesis/type III secretory pathway chaperone
MEIQAGKALTAVLEQEKKVLEQMADVLKGERTCIVHFDGPGLSNSLQRKEELCRKLAELDSQRKEYDRGITLSQWIAETEDENQRMVMSKLHMGTRSAAREVVALGHANQVVLKQVQAMFRSITGIIQSNEKEPYGMYGEKAESDLKGVLYNRRL